MTTTTTTTERRTYLMKKDVGRIVTLPDERAMNLRTGEYYPVPGKTYRIVSMTMEDQSTLIDDDLQRANRWTVRLRRVDARGRKDFTTRLSLPSKRTPGRRTSERVFTITG